MVRDWLGRDAAGYQSFASVFRAAESGEPSALDRLAGVAADMAQPAIVRASALARLAGSGQVTRDFAQRMAGDASTLVRMPTGLIVAIGQSMSLQLSRCSAG